MRRLVSLVLVLPLLAAGVVAAPEGGTRAEVRIGLPTDTSHGVAVEPDGRVVVLELPRGAVLPMDFAGASSGLVRSADVRSSDADRLRVELQLDAGYLARVFVDGAELVLTFQTRRASARPVSEREYELGPDDKIAVTVHNHPDLGATLTVSRQGTVTVPLIGTIDVAGRSPSAIELEIADLLGKTYLVDPQVDVSVVEYRSQWVMVTGEVAATGRIALRGGTQLKEVLSEAGGFRDMSGEKITISRRGLEDDQVETILVERREFEAGTSNPVLRHGDIIDVSKAEYCYIQGEVRNPSRVQIERGTTLLKAISLVGGLTEWADRRSVTILSGGEGSESRKVSLKRIQELKDPDPVLRGGEIVVVGRRFF